MSKNDDVIQQEEDAEKAHQRELAAKAKSEPVPKLSVPQSVKALRDHVQNLKFLMEKGSKSDTDQIPARLGEVIAWLDGVMDDKRDNPVSVTHATNPALFDTPHK